MLKILLNLSIGQVALIMYMLVPTVSSFLVQLRVGIRITG